MSTSAITVACVVLAVGLLGWAAYVYSRPPTADQEPLSEDELNHIVRRMGRMGDDD